MRRPERLSRLKWALAEPKAGRRSSWEVLRGAKGTFLWPVPGEQSE